jgi:hypothetical protein
MVSLLNAEDPVMSLLGNIASGFRLGAPDTPVYGMTPEGAPLPPRMSPHQQQSAFDALLAFGSSAADAAAPRFGPAPTFMQGLTDSLTAGRQQVINEQAAQAAQADLALKRQILQQQMAGQQLVARFLTRGLGGPQGVTDVTTETPAAPAGAPPGAAAPPGAPATPPGYEPGALVREALGAHESGARGYGATNSAGYTGRYQIGSQLASDAGFYAPAEGEDTAGNQWSGAFKIPGFAGVRTRDDFLRNPAAQDAAYRLAMGHMDKQLSALGVYDRGVGKTIGGVPVTRDGLLAGAWLGGPGGVKRWIDSGGKDDPADSNGTRVSQWVRLGAGAVPAVRPYADTGGGVPAPSPGPGGTVVRDVDPTAITTATAEQLAAAPPPPLPGAAAAPAAATTAAAAPLYVGDSLAEPGGIGGATGLGVRGAGPQAVLANIKAMPDADVAGRHVVLSSGTSNAPGDVGYVRGQIEELKRKGAASVTLVGVGDAKNLTDNRSNQSLEETARQTGARFVPLDPATLGADRVHPSDYTALRAASMPVAPAAGARGVAARTGGVDVAGPGGGASATPTAPPATRATTAPAGPPAPGIPARPIGMPPVPGMNRSALDAMTPRDRALFAASLLSMPPDKWPAVAAQLAMKPAETPSYQTIGNQVVGVYRDGTRVVIGPAHQEPFTVERLGADGNTRSIRVDPNTGTEQDLGVKATPTLTDVKGEDGQNHKGYLQPDGTVRLVAPSPTPPGSQPLDPQRQAQEERLRRAGMPSAEDVFQQKTGEAAAKQQGELTDAGGNAAGMVEKLRHFRSVAEGFQSGKLTPTASTVGSIATALGLDLSGIAQTMGSRSVTQAEVLQKISNELVKSQIAPGSGFSTNLSDADRVFLQQTMPAISNRPESNAVILAFLESAAQRTVDKSIAWDRSDDHSLKAWRNFNADWTEKQNKAPIIQKVETLEEGGLLPVNSVFRLPDGRFGVVTP